VPYSVDSLAVLVVRFYCWLRIGSAGWDELVGELDPAAVQDGGDYVDGVVVLVADLTAGPDAGWPADDQRVAEAALVGVALEHAERG
jgi:hypothetical protein